MNNETIAMKVQKFRETRAPMFVVTCIGMSSDVEPLAVVATWDAAHVIASARIEMRLSSGIRRVSRREGLRIAAQLAAFRAEADRADALETRK